MDFAEKYSCKSLNGAQTAHWNKTMVETYPAVAYFKQTGELKHKGFVIISNGMTHNTSIVCAFLDPIIPQLKLLKPYLRCIHY